MIVIRNNFLPKEVFASLQKYCKEKEFSIIEIGGKQFSVLEVPYEILEFLQKDGYEITLSIIRNAYKGFDTDLNIHADNIVGGKKTAIAGVLYINETDGVSPNGTRFYEHEKHGAVLSADVSNEEFDRLLIEDANDESKWTAVDEVMAFPNRFLTYRSSFFHSKFPAEVSEGQRVVMVVFYSKIIQ